ncbi:MAG: S-layer homology domain-containing protein [Firmicutes bacterium]|nr:S-layer homology domain-containing protein [Bacillota bacterium]
MAPLAGKFLWIWEVDQTQGGDVTAIANLGKRLGLTGFIVKSHDGTDVWPQFARVCKPLQAMGFAVVAWGYVYGTDPVAEAKAAQVGIAEGADAYVIDAETGYEGQPDAAHTLCTTLRAHNPTLTIGFSPFALPEDHPTFPYAAFASLCDVCLPQVYWGEFGLSATDAVHQSFSQLATYKLPIAPVGQAYGPVSAGQIEQFATAAKALGATGISFWDAQSADSRQQQAIRNITTFGPPPGPPTAPPAPTPTHSSQMTPPVPSRTAPSPAHPTTGVPSRATGPHSGPLRGEIKMPADVHKNDWFHGAVQDLLTIDVITAYQDGLFKPDEPITRAQAADWLNRLRIYLETHNAPASPQH